MAKKKKVSKKPVEKKKDDGFVGNLSSGAWIDKLTDGWGKPKSYNKDWNK